MNKRFNFVVHCETQEQFDACLEFAEKNGMVWFSGDKPTIGKFVFNKYKNKTCLDLSEGQLFHGYISHFEKKNKTILSFSEFKKQYLTK